MNRIDNNQLHQLQSQTKKTGNTPKTPAADADATGASPAEAAPASGDTVQISDTGRQLNEMEKSMESQSFNQEAVSRVKQAVDSKTYSYDYTSIAQKMVDFDN